MTRLAGVDNSHANYSELDVKTVVEHLLSRTTFVGVYLERRYVDFLKDYRDVVLISNAETKDFLMHVNHAMKRLKDFYGDSKWIGITGPNCIGAPAGYCLWVKDLKLPLGQHEFCVRKVKFTGNEIFTALKSVKFMDASTDASWSEQSKSDVSEGTVSLKVNAQEISEWASHMWKQGLELLTLQNTKMVFSFLILAIVLLCKALISCINGLGEFTIRFMHESTKFVHAIMPLILSCMDLLNKIIGACFILISMIFREMFKTREQPAAINFNNRPIHNRSPQMRYNRFR